MASPQVVPPRGAVQKGLDFLSFPLRSVLLFGGRDRWGLSSLATERFHYVRDVVAGHCLDVGCGRHNRFVTAFLGGDGRGIDVFPYDGLSEENLVDDLTHFPFPDETFASVAFIASLNHVPEPDRDAELAEAYRCLKRGGNIIVTMGNPLAELAVHRLVAFYDRRLGTRYDVDTERGMKEGEDYYLKDAEIRERLERAGFTGIRKKYFLTQWCLNHLFVGWKG